MARWASGEQTVQFLVDRNRLESFEAADLGALTEALIGRAGLRVDAISAQFGVEIPAFAKPTFERFRRARHAAQYFDPSAAPLTAPDAEWAIGKAKEALSGVRALLTTSPPERFG